MKKAGKLGKQLRRKESDWEWLERYRVWDANRKIFLYPENWIEPEIDYLLERIEDYAGLETLATANRSKIDNAFSRRFHFVISMPLRRKPRWKESSVR